MTWSQLYDYMMCVLWYDLVTVIWLHDVCPMIWPGHSYMCPMIWPGHSYMTTWYVSYYMTWSQLYDYMMCVLWYDLVTVICALWYDLVTVIWLHDMCPMIWPGYSYMTTWWVLSSFMTGFVTKLTRRVTSGGGTANSSGAPEFLWGLCYSIFCLMCMFCRWLFVLLYFFFWPLCCLLFFDKRILITPLVSSNSF
jgi:hypothetical protein